MRFTTAIEFIKNGYFVADAAMVKMGAAIGLVNIEKLDNSLLVMRDEHGMETFSIEPEILFGDEEWFLAIDDENEGVFNYSKVDDSRWSLDMFIVANDINNSNTWDVKTLKEDGLTDTAKVSGIKFNPVTKREDHIVSNKPATIPPEERLKQLQKDFLSKTTKLIYESDITKKIALYTELADITTEIQKLEKEVH